MATTRVKSALPAGLLPVVIALLLMTTPVIYVTCDIVTADVNAFACPYDGCDYIATIPAGTAVFVYCIANGVDVNGNSQWDYVGLTSDGNLVGYVSDYYVDCDGIACVGQSC